MCSAWKYHQYSFHNTIKDWAYIVLMDHNGALILISFICWMLFFMNILMKPYLFNVSCNSRSMCVMHIPLQSIEFTETSNTYPSYVPHNQSTYILSLTSFFHGHFRYRYNFGLEDKSFIVPHDMQALVKSTQKK